ncbi:MAG: hypothetical protein DHS20C15_09170 [Planctomycetota bacterium]|nr:MAG: hypothetical protein DHS20C15_09170 [Planctomycetota bacterium]
MSAPEELSEGQLAARRAAEWLSRDHAAAARTLGAQRAASEVDALARLSELVGVVFRLRDPDGCPWDRKQTLSSMVKNLREEAAEVAEAVAERDDAHTAEELGDTLMNILLMARIAEQEGRFDLAAVASGIAEKLVRRHAHVFGDVSAADADAALASWKATKVAEKGGVQGSRLDGVPPALDTLAAAAKLGGKAADAGFDWPDPSGAFDKLHEELAELEDARAQGESQERLEDELGDVLFSVVNVARKLKLDPELALRRTLEKFRRRFSSMEAELGEGLSRASLEELETLWRAAAERER